MLSRLTVDNNEVTLPKGTFNSSTNETSYADYTTSALTASTVIDVRFAAKKTVSVTANPLSATKDEVLAGKNLPVITFTPNTIAGQKVQYKNASGAYPINFLRRMVFTRSSRPVPRPRNMPP